MAGGMLILALTAVRFIARLRTRRPEELSTGYSFLDAFIPLCHYGLYVLVVLMVATGYTTAILAGLNKIVFMKSGAPLPADLTVYPTFVAHAALAIIFASLVVLHILAAVFHQVIRKDGIMRRMSFGPRILLPPVEREQRSERSGVDRA
jgi:cytochrome b561